MTVSAPGFAIKPAGREGSSWNPLIMQVQYARATSYKSITFLGVTSILTVTLANGNIATASLPFSGITKRSPMARKRPGELWRRGEESNPHPFGASVFETGGRPFRPAPPHPCDTTLEHRVRVELTIAGLQPAAWPIGFGCELLAGDRGIEPRNTGFGVRRSPNRACPQTAEAFALRAKSCWFESNDKRAGTIGFGLLTILQRRLASSPEASYQSLRRQ